MQLSGKYHRRVLEHTHMHTQIPNSSFTFQGHLRMEDIRPWKKPLLEPDHVGQDLDFGLQKGEKKILLVNRPPSVRHFVSAAKLRRMFTSHHLLHSCVAADTRVTSTFLLPRTMPL